jgi:hypothetical protein
MDPVHPNFLRPVLSLWVARALPQSPAKFDSRHETTQVSPSHKNISHNDISQMHKNILIFPWCKKVSSAVGQPSTNH